MFVTGLFRREHSTMSRVEDTKLRTHHHNPQCHTTSVLRRLRPTTSASSLRPPGEESFHRELTSLLPLAVACFSKCSLTTGAKGNLFISHDACPVSRSPNAHVWIPDHTVHRREIRTERLHLSSQMSDRRLHGTVALQNMTKFRSCVSVFV